MTYKVKWPECHVCGTTGGDVPVYHCVVCGKPVCKDHYVTSPDNAACVHELGATTEDEGWKPKRNYVSVDTTE